MLILYFTLSVIAMILIPVILAALLRLRFQVPWILFAAGTLVFAGSQLLHFPLNSLLMRLHILPKTGINDPTISLLQTALVLGLTAGLCEEGARAIGYALLKKYRKIEDGIMYGLGHGGLEAMIFGAVLTAATISSFAPMIGKDLSALNLSPEQLAYLNPRLQALAMAPFTAALNPLIERLLAIALQVIFSLLVLQAFVRRNAWYFVVAVGYHMLIDAVAVYISSTVPERNLSLLVTGLLLLPGLAWLAWMWRKAARQTPPRPHAAGAELAIFAAALRKETIQQWRTKRFLVVVAVFVLFGLTSPLVAKFTPEIIKNVAGAEQFASLIPTPSAADAMSQYIKNITQFGFILAVLLGMSAVAGEKEAGTAAMILSKPMPRWAFVLSKFSAQTLVYATAFLVAGLGAYYYTVILFGPTEVGKFLGINLLLFVWLLTFVAASLVGSVIGSSVAAAAGIGLGISVAILLAGNIPQYGALMPNGLLGWAAMLGAGAAKATADASTAISSGANAGALAGGCVLILLCLIWSVALFEGQEI